MVVLAFLVLLTIVCAVAGAAMVYGAHRVWQFTTQSYRRGAVALSGVATSVYMLAPNAAHAQSFDVDVDLSSFFDSMNAFLPTMLAIFGLIGGIIGAIALAQMVIDKVVAAFRG